VTRAIPVPTGKAIMMPTRTFERPGIFNKVPAVTVEFWLIKLLAVTIGETAADYMNLDLGLGLSKTSWLLSTVLIVALMLQFAQKKYVPWIYWVTVVLISVVGTLVTDNLVDNFGVRLETTTIAFSLALAVTFAVWYAVERTLSIHTIYTPRRRSLLLARHPVHFCARDSGRRFDRRRIWLRLPSDRSDIRGHHRGRSRWLFLRDPKSRPRLLARLHLHPTGRRIPGRSLLAAAALRRAGIRDDCHELHLPCRHRWVGCLHYD